PAEEASDCQRGGPRSVRATGEVGRTWKLQFGGRRGGRWRRWCVRLMSCPFVAGSCESPASLARIAAASSAPFCRSRCNFSARAQAKAQGGELSSHERGPYRCRRAFLLCLGASTCQNPSRSFAPMDSPPAEGISARHASDLALSRQALAGDWSALDELERR